MTVTRFMTSAPVSGSRHIEQSPAWTVVYPPVRNRGTSASRQSAPGGGALVSSNHAFRISIEQWLNPITLWVWPGTSYM